MTFLSIGIVNLILLVVIPIFSKDPWFALLLTVAQLVYVPITLHMVFKGEERKRFQTLLQCLSIPAFLAIMLLQVTGETKWDGLLSGVYWLFTIFIACYGLVRLLNRGFAYIEEFAIDLGLVYLALGGAWFVAYESNIYTGFSPMITWLTAVHFHYSAFLLPVYTGFVGRLHKSRAYNRVTIILLVSPLIVALGITLSTFIELVSVLLYIIGIYGLIIITHKVTFHSDIQRLLVLVSFDALGITILFSLAYAISNLVGSYAVSISFMLGFHGLTNGILFALFGLIGWRVFPPVSRFHSWKFPISKIRGRRKVGNHLVNRIEDSDFSPKYKGLVDDMNVFSLNKDTCLISPTIQNFYENTNQYRLYASVNWHTWFKPIAFFYRLLSKKVQQINLPITSKQVEMVGDIIAVQEKLDGRAGTRAWVRKIKEEIIFVALYALHSSQGKTYMNIALPLPLASMIGVLQLELKGKNLRLTSRQQSETSDAGIFLAIKSFLFKLPLEEQFDIQEVEPGILRATHQMWFFSLPFLSIAYEIVDRDLG